MEISTIITANHLRSSSSCYNSSHSANEEVSVQRMSDFNMDRPCSQTGEYTSITLHTTALLFYKHRTNRTKIIDTNKGKGWLVWDEAFQSPTATEAISQVACVAGLEVVGTRKNGAREGNTRGERERLPERPDWPRTNKSCSQEALYIYILGLNISVIKIS